MHTTQSMHGLQSVHGVQSVHAPQSVQAAHSMPVAQASGRYLSLRLFNTFVHVVEPVKSPYNAAVRRDSGERARKLRVTYDPLSRQIGC
jgi:hypothetical protein